MPVEATYEYSECGVSIENVQVTLQDGSKEAGWLLTIHDINPFAPAKHILPLDRTSRDKIIEGLSSGIVPATAADISNLR